MPEKSRRSHRKSEQNAENKLIMKAERVLNVSLYIIVSNISDFQFAIPSI